MKELYRTNLLFVAFFFCLGLIAGVEPNAIVWVSAFTCFCCSCMVLIAHFSAFRHHLFFASSFFIIGLVGMQASFPLQNHELEFQEETFFIATIDEQLRKGTVWETDLISVEKININGRWLSVNEKALLLAETSSELMKEGDRILVKSNFNMIENNGNPGEFNAVNYWISKGVRYQCFGFTENVQLVEEAEVSYWNQMVTAVRSYSIGMIEKFVSKEAQGLAQAILIGDKSNLDLDTKNSFANAGAVHVLAVSGLHIGIIAYLLTAIFQLLFKGDKRKIGIVLIILFLWMYALITGFSPSVTRAVLMFSILIGAQLFSKKYSPLNSLALAALILLIWNPLYLFDPGFQLSFLAMIGIFLVYDKLDNLFYIRSTLLKKVWQGTAIGLSAQLLTFPLSLYLFYQFPNYFVLANLGVMLLSNVILGGGIALVILGAIPILNVGIAWVLSVSIVGLIVIVDWVQNIPGSVAHGFNPSLMWTVMIYGVILFFIGVRKKKMLQTFGFGVFIILICSLQYDRYGNLNQGEICIFNTNHPTVLINHAGNQICAYSGEETGLKKAEQLVANYQRIHPGEVKFIELSEGELNVGNQLHHISISRKRFYVDLTIDSADYRIITSSRYWLKKEELQKNTIISAPYLSQQNGLLHHLKSGAFHCSLDTF